MSISVYLRRFLTDPKIRFGYLAKAGFYNRLSDEEFIRRRYRLFFGREPDLDNPRTYTEKVQWLKLHEKNPSYAGLDDKY